MNTYYVSGTEHWEIAVSGKKVTSGPQSVYRLGGKREITEELKWAKQLAQKVGYLTFTWLTLI